MKSFFDGMRGIEVVVVVVVVDGVVSGSERLSLRFVGVGIVTAITAFGFTVFAFFTERKKSHYVCMKSFTLSTIGRFSLRALRTRPIRAFFLIFYVFD